VLPAPEPSKPLTIEYKKPAATTAPDRAASTTFDVDLHEPAKTDTYGTISKSFYNDEKYAAALSEYNGRRALQGGVRVEVPPIHILKKRYPTLIGAVVPASAGTPAKDPWQPAGENTPAFRPTAGRTFTVPTGGLRMAEIARMTLGSPTKWQEIYDINPSISPSDLLPAGTVVKIPETK
jgi:nucleoid-associated protein YgaU